MTTDEPEELSAPQDLAITGYVFAGKLCLLGIAKTPFGPIPLSTRVNIGSEIPDGPVDFASIPEPAQPALERAHNDIIDKLQFETMRASAESVVERARAGDQNAMAMIVMIREAAGKGSKRAVLALDMLKETIRKNPIESRMGEERPQYDPAKGLVVRVKRASMQSDPYSYSLSIATYLPSASHDITTIVMLANGPLLYRKKIFEIASSFGSEETGRTFLAGTLWQHRAPAHLDEQARKIFDAGRCIGIARSIQGIRCNGVPLKTLSPRVAWELGE
jgi:hypothetical protein